uniref:Uncharacterized protein n=1 Tax=Sphaerodactylus townsendi TaxID=933632 RepID=A0ACB8FBZ7_9SAUR
MGQVPDKDKTPRNLDLGDEEKDALIPNRYEPHLGAARNTDGGERDEMWQEIHFLRCNMKLLLARTEAAERDRQDPPQRLPPLPLEGEQPVPAPPMMCHPGNRGHWVHPGHSCRSSRSSSV